MCSLTWVLAKSLFHCSCGRCCLILISCKHLVQQCIYFLYASDVVVCSLLSKLQVHISGLYSSLRIEVFFVVFVLKYFSCIKTHLLTFSRAGMPQHSLVSLRTLVVTVMLVILVVERKSRKICNSRVWCNVHGNYLYFFDPDPFCIWCNPS